jgi:hypothetical protein
MTAGNGQSIRAADKEEELHSHVERALSGRKAWPPRQQSALASAAPRHLLFISAENA